MDGGDLKLAPGFRFHPTDEELVMHYLCRRCAGQPIPAPIIAEVDLYKYDPWLLPGLAIYGEKEWYFFSPRDRKYPNGSRPNRAVGSGYWKATGADKPVGLPKPVAIKKALVFYAGKAPKGVKTNWIMHEYRLAGVDRSARRKHSLRLDDWVLCRIHNKKGGAERQGSVDRKPAGSRSIRPPPADILPEPMKLESYPDVAPTGSQVPDPASLADLLCFGASESLPRLHADSSCSEHVLSPEFTCDREVESQLKLLKWGELERALEIPATNMDAAPVFPPLDSGGQLSPLFGDPLQDVFMYLQKPF